MAVRCHLKEGEREHNRYLLVTPDTKELLVLCPIVGGTFIGTDNTCKSVKEMQTFFAKEHDSEEKRNSCVHYLSRYIEALQMDEDILSKLRPLFTGLEDAAHSALLQSKGQRREQAGKFKAALQRVQRDPELNVLSGSYPHHPAAVKAIMSMSPHGLCSMLLCPRSLDSYIRFDHMASFKLRRAGSHFADKLRSALSSGGSGAAASQDPQARLEEAVTAQFGTAAFEFATLVTFLGVKSEELFAVRIADALASITREQCEETMGFDGTEPAEDYVMPMLQFGQIDLSVAATSALATAPANKLETVLQIFLGLVGLFSRARLGFSADLGATLDGAAERHARALAVEAKKASPEVQVISYLVRECGVPDAARSHAAELTRMLNESWLTVRESPHFDEFCLCFNGVAGQAAVHQGCITLNVAQLVSSKPQWASGDGAFFNRLCGRYRELQPSHPLSPNNTDACGGALQLDWSKLRELPRDAAHAGALAKLLLCREDPLKMQRLYETIEEGFFTDLLDVMGDANLQDMLLPQLSTQQELDALTARFISEGRHHTRVSRVNAYSIYSKACALDKPALDGLDNRLAPNKLTAALRVLATSGNLFEPTAIGRIYMSNTLAGYTIETTESAAAALAELFRAPIDFHLTPAMARSVYVSACNERGTAYFEEQTAGLDNSAAPDKLKKALMLCGIDVEQMRITFHGYDGYNVSAPPELAEQIEALHRHIENPEPAAPTVRTRGQFAAMDIH